MARISLYQKRKNDANFNEVLSTALALEKPIPFIMSTFDCTYQTALKFLKEAKPTFKEENSGVLATNYIRRVEERIKNNPSFSTLLILRDDLNRFSMSTLKLIFKSYTEKDSLTNLKSEIISGIAYSVQQKYYEKVYRKEISLKLFLKTQDLIKVCTC